MCYAVVGEAAESVAPTGKRAPDSRPWPHRDGRPKFARNGSAVVHPARDCRARCTAADLCHVTRTEVTRRRCGGSVLATLAI